MPKVPVNQISRIFDNEEINVFVCSSSFEDRCFDIPINISSRRVHSIVFFNSNEDQRIIKNSRILEDIFRDNVVLASLSTDRPIDNFIIIIKIFEALFVKENLNIFLDTTTFTHETLLVILKIIHINRARINKLVIGYVGASDYSYNTGSDEEKWLSKGIKEIRTVIGYSGYSDPTLKNHLIILFGFESDRTQQLIDSYEFNKVSLGFVEVSNAIQSNHYKINFDRHSKLLETYPFAEKFDFSLINPNSTKSTLLSLIKQNPNFNTVIAPMNNKISTIGAGMAALENSDIQISYAKPLVYNSTAYSKSNGIVHYFKLSFKE